MYRYTEQAHLFRSADMRYAPRTSRNLSHLKHDIKRSNAMRLINTEMSTNCPVLSSTNDRHH